MYFGVPVALKVVASKGKLSCIIVNIYYIHHDMPFEGGVYIDVGSKSCIIIS